MSAKTTLLSFFLPIFSKRSLFLHTSEVTYYIINRYLIKGCLAFFASLRDGLSTNPFIITPQSYQILGHVSKFSLTRVGAKTSNRCRSGSYRSLSARRSIGDCCLPSEHRIQAECDLPQYCGP